MTQLVVWIVVATVNPTGAWAAQDHGYHGQRFVAVYTTQAECQRHVRSITADQQRTFAKTPDLIYEIYGCEQTVVKTECHNYADGRC